MKFLSQFIAIVLLMVFSLHITGKFIVVMDYTINKEYIANVLCINKEKPVLKCEGRCHLKKELQKEEEKEQSPFNPFKEVKDFQLYSNNTSIDCMCDIAESDIKNNFAYISTFSKKYSFSIFHPPQV